MEHLKVRDLMNEAVVHVQRGTPFKEIAHLLSEYAITAVPVVDDEERPLGVVSEADLLQKIVRTYVSTEMATDEAADPGPWTKARATTAEGLMSAPALCAHGDWTVVDAALAMEKHRVKRLLVTDEEDRLIGVVSRSDLLRVFLRKDAAIRSEIVEEVVVKTLGEPPSAISVDVAHGHVVLSGRTTHEGSATALTHLILSVDGVVSVELRLE